MTFDERTKRLKGCHPDLIRKVTAIVVLVEQQGYRLMVTEGKRSYARQLALYAQGRTKPGPKVTWTMKSNHLTGKAADLVFLDKEGRPSWSEKHPWHLIGKAAKHFGLTWGGDFKTPDRPHVELPH